MKYAIVTVEWCMEHGIIVPKHARKSIDGSKVLLHKDFITPVLNGEVVELYEHDSEKLATILSGEEWTETV